VPAEIASDALVYELSSCRQNCWPMGLGDWDPIFIDGYFWIEGRI